MNRLYLSDLVFPIANSIVVILVVMISSVTWTTYMLIALAIFIWYIAVRGLIRKYKGRVVSLGERVDDGGSIIHWFVWQRFQAISASFFDLNRPLLEDMRPFLKPQDAETVDLILSEYQKPILIINMANVGRYNRKLHESPEEAVIWLDLMELHELTHWAGGDHLATKEKSEFEVQEGWNAVLLQIIHDVSRPVIPSLN